MRRRDLGWLIAYGVGLVFLTWIASAACVSMGWLLPPGDGPPIQQ